MTSLMQFFGCSLNKIAKFRRHEKENSMRRNAFDLAVSELKVPLLLPDDAETLIDIMQIYKMYSVFRLMLCAYTWRLSMTKNPY